MKESRYYIKRLTSAEAQVDNNNVHEIYIRLNNDFDYKSFFQNEGIVNGTVREIEFTVEDLTYSHPHKKYDLRFVYYENSNQEKRIPSLANVFKEHGVLAGDTVCLESRTVDGNTSFYITFNKMCDFPLSDDCLYYSVKEGSVNQLELYKTLTNEQREKVFAYYIEHLEARKVGKDQISKYSHTYIPHINKYASKVKGVTTLFDVISLGQYDKICKIASKDRNPDPNYAGAYQSSLNKYGRMLIELMSSNCRFDMRDFGASLSYSAMSDTSLPLQLIYFGAPGTSKSTAIKLETEEKGKEVHRITFHPDTDYSNFVGCYKPTTVKQDVEDKIYGKVELIDFLKQKKDEGVSYPYHKFAYKYWKSVKSLSTADKKEILSKTSSSEKYTVEFDKAVALGEEYSNTSSSITYKFVAQTFINAYVSAWEKFVNNYELNKDVFLVIEEINRGNCAQIFGDLFQLLDRNETGYSDYTIEPDRDLQDYLRDAFKNADLPEEIKSGKKMQLPPNLYIWATMNTSDQSLFPIDSAFKRRWDWRYTPITKPANKNHKILVNGKHYDWWEFLGAVNDRIEDITESEDKQLGYWFARPKKGEEIDVDTFVGKVMFYLWNDIFKDFGEDERSPFMVKKVDDKDKKEKVTFRKFFDKTTGKIDAVMAERFLVSLGLDGTDVPTAPKPVDQTPEAEDATPTPAIPEEDAEGASADSPIEEPQHNAVEQDNEEVAAAVPHVQVPNVQNITPPVSMAPEPEKTDEELF